MLKPTSNIHNHLTSLFQSLKFNFLIFQFFLNMYILKIREKMRFELSLMNKSGLVFTVHILIFAYKLAKQIGNEDSNINLR